MTTRENYNKIFDNGLAHINSAKLLADSGAFGFAISHLILGIEELIKYQVVMVHGVDETLFEKEASLQGKKTIFRDNGTKHDLIKEFQESIAPGFAELLIESKFFGMLERPLTPEHIRALGNRFKQTGSFLGVAYQEINIPAALRPAFFEWLEKANDSKNNGFYVNYQNGLCIGPEIVTEKNSRLP